MYSGLTCDEPPPPVTALSLPMSAIECSADFLSGRIGAPATAAFFSSTMPSSAMCRATAPSACAGIGVIVGVRSNSPNRIIVAYRRTSLSLIVAILICPALSAAVNLAGLKFAPVGVSRSRPALAEPTVLCTAPKSENTNPSKPHSFFRIPFKVTGFSQLYVPLIFGYAHITVAEWPSLTAASNAGR